MHARVHENPAHARAGHMAARGGWNKAVKTSAGSWDDGDDPGVARRSCGGTKVYRFGLEKAGVEHHRRIENGTAAGGGKRTEVTD
jgi:hypothetical protein